jgi:hypothetical protein
MFNSTVLDVAIGLAFVYLLLGLMCTTVNEWIAGMLKRRAKNLEEGIRRLLAAPADGTQSLRTSDLKDPGKLLLQLKTPTDPLSTYIRSNFDPANQAKIDAFIGGEKPSDEIMQALCDELNKQIASKDLFDKQRFPKTAIAPDQIAKAVQDPDKLRELNRNLLQDAYPDSIGTLADEFYGHPLIRSLIPKSHELPRWRRMLSRKSAKGLGMTKKAHPSYVPARAFALSIMDIILKGQQGPTDFKNLLAGINALPESDVKRSLLALMQNTDGELSTAQERIEGWFNDAMDRVAGWYKRQTQVITVIVAVVIVIFANADTIQIANKLFVTPALRDSVIAAARERAAGPRPITIEYTQPDNPKPSPPVNGAAPNTSDSGDITSTQRQLLGQLSGWTEEFRAFNRMTIKTPRGQPASACIAEHSTTEECAAAIKSAEDIGAGFPGVRFLSAATGSWLMWLIPQHLVGWILSAIAVSLGAPFWFDTLNRFMNIRSSGKSPAEKPKGAEKKAA